MSGPARPDVRGRFVVFATPQQIPLREPKETDVPTGYRAISRIAPNRDSRPDWMVDGLCRSPDVDPNLHFPPPGRRGHNQAAEATAMCMQCPVVAECREWSLTNREPYGVWGALTTAERRRVLANRASGAPDGLTGPVDGIAS